jgi:hypothetical protein
MKRRDFFLLAGVMAMAWNPAGAEVKIPRIPNGWRVRKTSPLSPIRRHNGPWSLTSLREKLIKIGR